MKRQISIFVLVCFTFLTVFQEALFALSPNPKQYTIAILPLEAQGNLNSAETTALSNRLAQEFNGWSTFTVMSQAEVDQALLNYGIMASNCSSVDCGLRAGKTLGVDLVANGTVRSDGFAYYTDMRIIHVKSGKVVKTYQDTFDGSFADFENHMAYVAAKLVGKTPKPATSSSSSYPADSYPGDSPYGDDYPAERQETVQKKGSSKLLLVGLLVAGGVGAGIYFASKNKTTSSGNGDGGDTSTVTVLPAPPSFP